MPLAHRLINDYEPNVFEVATYVNINKQLYCQGWARNHREVREVNTRIAEEAGVGSVTTDIFLDAFQYDTWRDEYLDEMAGKSAGVRE